MVLHPAMAEMARRSAAYPYQVPVMPGPGYMGPYNYIRKPACDFGCARSMLLRKLSHAGRVCVMVAFIQRRGVWHAGGTGVLRLRQLESSATCSF